MACLPEETIAAFSEGRMEADELSKVHRHIDVCSRCRQHLLLMVQLDSSSRPSPQAPRSAPPSLDAGQRVGPYILVRKLGRGGMGTVYEGRHLEIGSRVAIKILHPGQLGEQDEAHHALLEARMANRVTHPGLLHIFEIGALPEGGHYLVMEYVEGEPLSERLRRTPALGHRLLPLLQQAATTLSVLHAHGVVHRDLKPANLMIVPDPFLPGGERSKLMDFGLAKAVQPEANMGLDRGGPSQGRLMIGTPSYMSPEQCAGDTPIDGQADVYALGVLLYELCAGRPPFQATSAIALCAMHRWDAPPPLPEDVPRELRALIGRMLAKDPAARPAMTEVARVLPSASRSPPSRARRLLPPLLLCLLFAPLLAAGVARLPRMWRLRTIALLPTGRPVSSVRPSPQVALAGGAFWMGSTYAEIEQAHAACRQRQGECPWEQFAREGPRRRVELAPFLFDETEVTYHQFAAWLNVLIERPIGLRLQNDVVRDGDIALINIYAEPSFGMARVGGHFEVSAGFEDKPVDRVSWHGATRFCQHLGRRLPTESEWEFAARGLAGRTYPWGSAAPTCTGVAYARCSLGTRECDDCGGLGVGPSRVASSPQDRTPEGIYDLGGNVAEWVEDEFKDTVLFDKAVHRVLRGGGWAWSALALRGASRSRWDQDATPRKVGFRCAAASEGSLRP